MSAVKIIFKRSSIPGKRPTNSNLEVGEIGLNTNANDPGLFFEVNNDTVVKVGPTAVLPEAPVSVPSKGELWLNTQDGTLNAGVFKDSKSQWQSIAAPYLGGGGYVVFVAPEFAGATDSIKNNGQALPFQTLTRAILELSKITINAILAGSTAESENSKYTIYVAPSRITANNAPGTTVAGFTVDFSQSPYGTVTTTQLSEFNSPTGGIIIPRGISIVGLDLKKCTVSPTYVPRYQNPAFSETEVNVNQPISSIFKATGNTLFNNFSFLDKIDTRDIVRVEESPSGTAIFYSSRPHGLEIDDKVSVAFSPGVNQSTGTFQDGEYYAYPLDTFSFYLRVDPDLTFVEYSSLPIIPASQNVILYVTNELYSAHRLRGLLPATEQELADYYTKVQRAFPDFFGGQVTDGAQLVSQAEYVIVASTDFDYPNNFNVNTTRNSSAYASSVNLRSDYGMCWGEVDGSQIEGFRSLIANECTCVSLQRDPAAYEIYTTLLNPVTNVSEQKWWSLARATYLSLPLDKRPGSVERVPREEQLELLNKTKIKNIRYYYQSLKTPDGKTTGITDTDNDFRHFGFLIRDGAYAQLQSIYTIGCAVGAWALNGGFITLTNSTTNFGSVAIKSEGFKGVNTVGGAEDNQTGFLFEGIQRPLSLTHSQATSGGNKRILSLGARVVSVELEPDNPTIKLVSLSSEFSPCYILPYSLLPGSAVWIGNVESGQVYRGFLATDGGPTVIPTPGSCGLTSSLRLRASDSSIPVGSDVGKLEVPYIRRFSDPRSEFDRTYSFKLSNTYPNVIPPQVGSVLRLNQINQAINPGTLRPNVQFDPGVLGGWGRIFTVDQVVTASLAESPQYNSVIGDSNENVNYYVSVTVSDYSRPWNQQFENSTGSYVTYQQRNWYAAENNIWKTLYYGEASSFRPNAGPYKIAPTELCSPFVETSVLERQELVSDCYQGTYAKDVYLEENVYSPTDTYFRGATYPYTSYTNDSYLDWDDGSRSLGICLMDVPTTNSTTTTSGISVIQTALEADALRRYRPAIVQFTVADPSVIVNPTSAVSVVLFADSTDTEYMQIISKVGSTVQAIRLNSSNSFYPDPTTQNKNWTPATPVIACQENRTPEAKTYDPIWSNTKQAVLRFFEIMGYPNSEVLQFLGPRYWGDRTLEIKTLPFAPSEGYALVTERWPLEFNTPSTVVANTHTWAYAGYLDYSRGLPKYQNNDLPRKLSADFQSTVLWGGKVTITGINNRGEIVLFGPQRQALTGRYYADVNPDLNRANEQLNTISPGSSASGLALRYIDDISSQFDGVKTVFTLQSGGSDLSPSTAPSDLLLFVGGAVQVPEEAFTWNPATSQVVFAEAPESGLYFVGWYTF